MATALGHRREQRVGGLAGWRVRDVTDLQGRQAGHLESIDDTTGLPYGDAGV